HERRTAARAGREAAARDPAAHPAQVPRRPPADRRAARAAGTAAEPPARREAGTADPQSGKLKAQTKSPAVSRRFSFHPTAGLIFAAMKTPTLGSAFVQQAGRLLTHALDGKDQLDLLGSRAEVLLDVEVLQLDRGAALETGTVAAPRVIALTEQLGLDHHRLGHAVEGQVAGDVGGAFAGALHRGGLEGGGGVLADAEEVVATQVLVALGVVGVDAGGLDGHLDLARLRVL